MEGEDYENKKDNLQSASGMPGILGIFCGRANVYADQKQALSATVTLLKQEKDCVVQVEAKTAGRILPGRCVWCFPVPTTPTAAHLNSA